MINTNNIQLGKLGKEMGKYENQWVAVTASSRIVAHGKSYGDAMKKVANPDEVVLLKVPPQDASLAPAGV